MTTSRLLRDERPSLSVSVNVQLFSAVFAGAKPPEREALLTDLERSVMSPGAVAIMRAAELWREERARRFMVRAGPRFRRVGDPPYFSIESPPTPKATAYDSASLYRHTFYGRPLSDAARQRDDTYDRLLAELPFAARQLLNEFERSQRRKGHDVFRVDLAVLRILEPLLEHAESAFIERDVGELSKQEIVTFVRSGITRERILLSRPPDRECARRLARDA